MTWPAPDPRKQENPQWAECLEVWPMCVDGDYHPNCCRWPKSCRCDMGDPRPWHIRERLLWPAPDPDERFYTFSLIGGVWFREKWPAPDPDERYWPWVTGYGRTPTDQPRFLANWCRYLGRRFTWCKVGKP